MNFIHTFVFCVPFIKFIKPAIVEVGEHFSYDVNATDPDNDTVSYSMAPAITEGSAVVIWKSENYKISDVITFGKENGAIPPTTHRIVETKPGVLGIIYITKGDANESADVKDIYGQDIIGKVVFHICIPEPGRDPQTSAACGQ